MQTTSLYSYYRRSVDQSHLLSCLYVRYIAITYLTHYMLCFIHLLDFFKEYKNVEMFLHFISFCNIEMGQVVEIPPCGKQGPICPA